MRVCRRVVVCLVSVLLPATVSAQTPTPAGTRPTITLEAASRLAFSETAGSLFENVVAMLQARYVDQRFRTDELPAIAARYRELAKAAKSIAEERQVVHQLLSHIPASHLGLLSRQAHRMIMADLLGVPYPSFGFQLIGAGSEYYAAMILEGGPAAQNGLLVGDRIVSIDNVSPRDSARLDWRTDDAYIGDDRDPAVHYLLAAAGDRIEVRVERRPGEFLRVSIPAEQYTAMDAARASVRIMRSSGASVGYLHFWYVHIAGVPEFLTHALANELRDVDALVVDLRGRGGSATEVTRIVTLMREYLDQSKKPVVALVDRQSRSGKDILAHEFKALGIRLVGEASAGAVIPASFGDVGFDSVLMFPTFRLPRYTDLLEFKPVEPDVAVARPGLFAAGRDGIIEAGLAEAVRLVQRGPQTPARMP